ncbi:YafY family protein [Lapillicoccus sp.]|uniref:helix-turn-helix transcriptional regulator n=1 Tax=Lapillicoccus sp. TaxID=1909287 RepID=UPI003267AD76
MRADRLLQILFLLRRHGRLPARRLAELLEVSERTILRDMEALSAAGVPVYSERGRTGGCVLMEGYSTDASGLTTGEAEALFAWTSRSAVSDLGLGPQLGTALTKLAASVPQPALDKADALAAVVVVDRRRWFAAVEEVPLLPALRAAAVDRKRVRLSYRSASQDRPTTRTVDPFGLVENAGRWYLLAGHRGHTRSYRVSRIAGAVPLTSAARIPAGLDLQVEWDRVRGEFEGEARRSGVDLVAAVDPEALHMFRLIATGQAVTGHAPVTEPPDGSAPAPADAWPVVRVSLRARQAAVALVMGFGGQARLLQPEDLVQELVERARASLAVHIMDS